MSRRIAFFATPLLAATLPFLLVLPAETLAPAPASTAAKSLAPTSDDGPIAYVTARALEQGHYRQHPFDDGYSEKFLQLYLEALDPQRLYFTKTDLAEFAQYRDTLDNLTLRRRFAADTTPAYRIFNRFLERLDQRVAYVQELLQNEQFSFDTDESVTVNRKDEPYPTDLDEARKLWRQRLRSEYLQEKIAKYAEKRKAERAPQSKTTTAASAFPQVTIDGLDALVQQFQATNKSPAQLALENDKPSNVLTNARLAEVAPAPKKTDAEDIVEKLTKRYTRNQHIYHELDEQEVLEFYLTSLAHVYDPHTDYFNPRQADNFAIGMNLSLFGIGAVLQSDGEGYCKIAELKPGPASKSNKIKAGDRIVAIAQSNAPPVDVVDMNLNKIVQMVRGPKGTEVRLTMVSADNTSDRWEVSLIREEIKLDDQAAKAKVIDLPDASGHTVRIGVIDLPSFYVPMDLGNTRRGAGKDAAAHYTSKDVAQLLTKLKAENVKGIILDLRRNGGGSLEECVKLTGLFIKDGPVVQVNGPGGDPFIDEDEDPSILYDGPLIVLTSRFSASASEILAGALQDYNRALIVGDSSTHGKGTVQQLNPLRMWIPESEMTNNPGTLKITKAKFYRASGASTQLKGVASDIVLPSKLNYAKDIGEAALENALPWDVIKSARFEKFNLVQPYLADLMTRSSQRLSTNQEYLYIREDIEQFRKYQALNAVSLNEQQRIKEWEEEDTRQRARNKERLARQTTPPTVYELTLKQVDLPGLPPPVAKTNAVAATTGTDDALADELALETPPAIDAPLEETQQIMLDYIKLMSLKDVAARAPKSVP